MYSNSAVLPNYPEWYRIERETEKTIKKLLSVKDLSFYLKNPDEYIRRLAVLRISELKPKEGMDVLKEIMDDRSESSTNKELAAWVIKSISLKWNLDLFLTNRLLNQYTGNEIYSEMYKVSVEDPLPSVKFEFASSLVDGELQIDGDNIRRSEDIRFDTNLSVKEWIKEYYREWGKVIIPALKRFFINLPVLILPFLKKLFIFIFLKLPVLLSKPIVNIVRAQSFKSNALKNYKTSYNIPYAHKRNPLEVVNHAVKKFIFNLFYVLFTPVRLMIKYKKLLLLTVAASYCVLAFSTPGKIFTYKNFGVDLMDVQTNVLNAGKEILVYASSELRDIIGLDERIQVDTHRNASKTTQAKASSPAVPLKQYKVTAKSGLVLRKNPNTILEKVQENSIPYNSTVTYLQKSQQDSTGKLWYYIQTPQSNKGWVNSKYLEEIGGAKNAGK